MSRTILIKDDNLVQKAKFVFICSGYLVKEGKVLLVHHNGFDKWVPPGGHIEPEDTFASAATREIEEETGLEVEIISSQPNLNPDDTKAIADPVPFYVDIEYEFKPRPAIDQFYWARIKSDNSDDIKIQSDEIYDVGWFNEKQLSTLPTFEQVRKLATYSLNHHPDVK